VSSRWITAAILAIIGLLAIVAAIIYLTVAAKSLPSFLGTLHHAAGHRSLRGIVALLVGLVLIGAAGWIAYYKPPASPSEQA
jgi:multisubunit Na+/H+ antiporter MnhB subunit